MFCRQCGNKLGDRDLFCARCGAPVNDGPLKANSSVGLTPAAKDSERIIEEFYRVNKRREETQAILDMEYAAIKSGTVDVPHVETITYPEPQPVQPVQSNEAFVIGAAPIPVVAPTPTPIVEPTAPVVDPAPIPVVEPVPTPTVAPAPAPVVEPIPTPIVPPVQEAPQVVIPEPTPAEEPTPAPTVTPEPAPVVEPIPTPAVAAVQEVPQVAIPEPAPVVEPTPTPAVESTPAPAAAPTPEVPKYKPTAEDEAEWNKEFPRYTPTLFFDPPEVKLYEEIAETQKEVTPEPEVNIEPEVEVAPVIPTVPVVEPTPAVEPASIVEPTPVVPAPTPTSKEEAESMFSQAEQTAAEITGTLSDFENKKDSINQEAQATLDMMEKMFAEFDMPLAASVGTAGTVATGMAVDSVINDMKSAPEQASPLQGVKPEPEPIQTEPVTSEPIAPIKPEPVKSEPIAPVHPEPIQAKPDQTQVKTQLDSDAEETPENPPEEGKKKGLFGRFGKKNKAAKDEAGATIGATTPDTAVADTTDKAAATTTAGTTDKAATTTTATTTAESKPSRVRSLADLEEEYEGTLARDKGTSSGNLAAAGSLTEQSSIAERRALIDEYADVDQDEEEYESAPGGIVKKALLGIFTALLAIAAIVSILVTFGRETAPGKAILDAWDNIKTSDDALSEEDMIGKEDEKDSSKLDEESEDSKDADNKDADAENQDQDADNADTDNQDAASQEDQDADTEDTDDPETDNQTEDPDFDPDDPDGVSKIDSVETAANLKITDGAFTAEGLSDATELTDAEKSEELAETISAYYTALLRKMNRNDDEVLSMIVSGSKLMNDISAIKPDAIVLHHITDLQIGETRANGSDYYTIVNIKETTNDGKAPTESRRLLHIVEENGAYKFAEVVSPSR